MCSLFLSVGLSFAFFSLLLLSLTHSLTLYLDLSLSLFEIRAEPNVLSSSLSKKKKRQVSNCLLFALSLSLVSRRSTFPSLALSCSLSLSLSPLTSLSLVSLPLSHSRCLSSLVSLSHSLTLHSLLTCSCVFMRAASRSSSSLILFRRSSRSREFSSIFF